jgi:hypothetical protein
MATQAEQDELDNAILVALNGTQVSVVAGNIIHDTIVKPLTTEGASMVYDRLKARGFKVIRA